MRRPGLKALTIGFLSTFLVATAGTGVAIYSVTLGTIERLVDRRIENVSAVLGDAATPAQVVLARIAALAARRDTGDIGFLLTDARGRRLGGNVAIARRLPLGYVTLRSRDRILGLSAGRAFTRPIGPGLRLTTIAETEPFDGYRAERLRIYLLGFGSIVVVVIGGLIVFAVTIARRFAETRATVEAIIGGDMQRRVAVTGSADEFDRQALAFNRMLDRIAELMDGLRNVSSDVAHDLRTPLARLRGRLTTLAAGAGDPAQAAALDAAVADCDDLLAMFAAMLRIAEVEAGRRTAGFAPVDGAALLADVAEAMAPVAEDGGRTLVWHPKGQLALFGDARLIEQAVVNGIDNALRHTPAGSTVTLAATARGGLVEIVIADDGPGIPAEDRATALRRFGRLEASRHRAGHGLGLPLIAAVMRLHGGTLVLEDGEPGLVLRLAFPDQKRTSASRP